MVRNSFFDPNLLQQMMPRQGAQQTPVLDLKAFIEIQRKNAQALADAFQLSYDTAQSVLTRQAEIFGRMIQDNSTIASTLISEGTPEQKVQKQTELMRKSYEQTVKNAREVGDMLTRSQEEAAELLNRRVSASLSELKFAFDTPQNAAQQWQKNAEAAWDATKQATASAAKAAESATAPLKRATAQAAAKSTRTAASSKVKKTKTAKAKTAKAKTTASKATASKAVSTAKPVAAPKKEA